MRARTACACAALAGVALAVGGCGKKSTDGEPSAAREPVEDAAVAHLPERAVVTSVEVKVVDPSEGPVRDVYPRELAKRFGATLDGAEWFVPEGEAPSGVRLRPAVVQLLVGYNVVSEGSTGEPAIIAVVEASLQFRDGRAGLQPAMNVLAERPYRPEDEAALDAVVAEHVMQAAADAAEALIVKEGARVGPPAHAIALLDSPDMDLRVWALAVIGHRGVREAYDAVLERLSGGDETERDAAIGALIALGDPRAVDALTRLADFQDYDLMRRVLDAVGILGGDEADAYLEFVATGHPDDEIKAQAAQALRRLRKRAERAARAAGGGE